MNRKGSVTTLLVVAVLALGLMTFVSLDEKPVDVAGAISPGPGPGPRPPGPGPRPLPPRPVIVDGGPETVVYEQPVYEEPTDTTGADIAHIQLLCHMWKFDHPNAQASVEIAGLCARFGVVV